MAALDKNGESVSLVTIRASKDKEKTPPHYTNGFRYGVNKKSPALFAKSGASWAPSSEPYPCNICRNNSGILLACADMDAAAWERVCFEVKMVTSAPKSTSVKVAREAFVFSSVIWAF